ncbi:YihY/virulence factor BrkB family protein [Chryseosolibacter indicus]|uniref:YihY/virulence factor BrkB family protein n=1 Tax=Chryseosolibacter indicus TaxID=2782351 RepID=A0ABS5VQ57_9BACT|nr:YihY/virulence factor BrkB family protein [Chryseosolibacter indicus]MBT1703584.1 YihY/virulence factor BrkB family protein [Chryseosolibacter indicus]
MKYKHKRRILNWSPIWFLIRWMRKVRFNKYEGISLYKIFKSFAFNMKDDEVMDRANGVAYNFMLAIFPAVIFLFTLIPFVTKFFPEVNTQSIMGFIRELMPPSMYEVVSTTVLDIVSNQRGGLLTLGFFFAMYLSTNGMMALMRAFNACYKTIEKRPGWKTRLIATGLTFNMAFVLFLATILLVVGEFVLDYVLANLYRFEFLNIDKYSLYLLSAVRFLVIFIVFFLAISTIYYFGPSIHYNWRFFSIGSFIATILALAVTIGFSFYVTNFANYNKVYGSIGVIIAIMIWVQLITVVLLIGYEINASIHEAIRHEALRKARRLAVKP